MRAQDLVVTLMVKTNLTENQKNIDSKTCLRVRVFPVP